MDRRTLLIVTIIVEGGLLILGLLLARFSEIALWSNFALSWNATGWAVVASIPMVAALYISEISQWTPLSRLKRELDEKVLPIFANCTIPDLAIIAILAGLSEELFFRGWLQGLLANKFGVWFGILLASLIFGLAHYLSTTYAVYAFLTGIYLGVLYQLSGNLYGVTAIHALYDFVALVYLVGKTKRPQTAPE